jgi:hypothetical protein
VPEPWTIIRQIRLQRKGQSRALCRLSPLPQLAASSGQGCACGWDDPKNTFDLRVVNVTVMHRTTRAAPCRNSARSEGSFGSDTHTHRGPTAFVVARVARRAVDLERTADGRECLGVLYAWG